MCCISKEKKTKTAETDIHVVKIVQKKAKGYRTPFTHHYLRKDIMSGEMPLVGVCDGFHFKGRFLENRLFWDRFIYEQAKCDKLYVYDKNFIHTYPAGKKFDFDNNRGYEVFDCIIPAGAEYVEGETYTIMPDLSVLVQKTYASSQIYFVGKHED